MLSVCRTVFMNRNVALSRTPCWPSLRRESRASYQAQESRARALGRSSGSAHVRSSTFVTAFEYKRCGDAIHHKSSSRVPSQEARWTNFVLSLFPHASLPSTTDLVLHPAPATEWPSPRRSRPRAILTLFPSSSRTVEGPCPLSRTSLPSLVDCALVQPDSVNRVPVGALRLSQQYVPFPSGRE
jgi:hypothetical protein